MAAVEAVLTAPLDSQVVRVAVSAALGLFLGLEREWSEKAAGIRTFALISVLGTIFTQADAAACVDCPPLLAATGALFTTVLAGVLMYSGAADTSEGLYLTTGVSLLVAYGVGVLVGLGAVLPATVVAVGSSILLVFKRELHGFAGELSRAELRSTAEFAILAFVVYPLLPAGSVRLGTESVAVSVEPRVVWLMVVFVAGLGIVNYAVVKSYGGRGIAVTGFFGGLASSTAVVGTMLDHVRRDPAAARYGVAAILLADAAMALRNLVVAVAFTATAATTLFAVAVPLGTIAAAAVVLAVLTADWGRDLTLELETPFSMRNALGFGALFLLVVLAGGVAEATLGRVGFYATAALTGLVSSAGATTSAVVLYRGGTLDADAAVIAVLLATLASVAVKATLAATGGDRTFTRAVALQSALLVAVGVVATVLVLQ
jgi:uncharacterized membrane protein (DUF4010 family)